MGLDIIAVSKAKQVACIGGDECDDTHWPVGRSVKRRDGLKPGCYVAGRGGRDTGFAINYNGYNEWRRELSILALGVLPEEVWEHPRRYRGKPFVALIDFPDCGVFTIGPSTSAKLYADFIAFASQARKHFQSKRVSATPRSKTQRGRRSKSMGLVVAEVDAHGGVAQKTEDFAWMWDVYRDFRRAFKLASNDGFVSFC
jgi:hypothetical protein